MRFLRDLRKYWDYTKQSAKAELKAEVASSYLNWLWWILDPLLFMMVYTFISEVVFGRGGKFFPAFVLIGLTIWNFFNRIVQGSVKLVKKNSAIVSKVYLPKFILIIQKIMVNGVKMFISFILIIFLMIFLRVPVTYNILFIIPILLELLIISFGIGNLMLHFGVFVEDLQNVMKVVMKLVFYMSGVFYSITDRVPAPYNELMMVFNPSAFLMSSARKCMIYGETPDLKVLLIWGIVGVQISVIALKVVYKYENSYVKVI